MSHHHEPSDAELELCTGVELPIDPALGIAAMHDAIARLESERRGLIISLVSPQDIGESVAERLATIHSEIQTAYARIAGYEVQLRHRN